MNLDIIPHSQLNEHISVNFISTYHFKSLCNILYFIFAYTLYIYHLNKYILFVLIYKGQKRGQHKYSYYMNTLGTLKILALR